MNERALNRIVAALLSFCFLFILQVAYWLLWPYEVMTIKSIKITKPTVEVGEFFEYELNYCKNPDFQDLYAHVQHSFLDGLVYNMPLESGPLAAGCAIQIVGMTMPTIPEGRYRLQMSRMYDVNRLRTITIRAISGEFTVSGKQRLKEMLRQQLPDVIHEVAPKIPELR